MVLALFSQAVIPYREIDRVEIKSYTDYDEVWIRRHAEALGELITIKSKKAAKMIEVFKSLGVRCEPGYRQSG